METNEALLLSSLVQSLWSHAPFVLFELQGLRDSLKPVTKDAQRRPGTFLPRPVWTCLSKARPVGEESAGRDLSEAVASLEMLIFGASCWLSW